MQTTLLTLAIAVILALVAALVAPLVVDWTQYRPFFEAEAKRLIGVDVRVTGAIEARLLPSPQLTLHGVEIGSRHQDQLKARSLGIEFGLSPLMRGEWRATDLHLVGPAVKLGIDGSGRMQWPALAISFDPEALAIERIGIEDGRVVVSDAGSGSEFNFEKFAFKGEARSLLGPFKGEGSFTLDGEVYPYRVAAGRLADDMLKLHLDFDPVRRPLATSVDGLLSFERAEPRFEGTLTLTRPVGIAASGGGARVTQPWRANAKVRATAASALLEQIEFQYGSDEQGVKLTGTAEMKFGRRPQFDGLLSARQIDLDRALSVSEGQRVAPAAALRQVVESVGGALRPPVPAKLGVGIDLVTLGGAVLQSVRGDISSAANGWSLDRFEFRAPGLTQVRLSGRLALDANAVAFTGPASIETGDLKALVAWLEGRAETAQSPARSLRARGEVTLGSERVAIERLKAELDRESVEGLVAYTFASGGRPPRLEADLRASELDIDATQSFLTAALTGSAVERPGEIALALDIGRATVAGVSARQAKAQLRVDAAGLQIDALSVADLSGASLKASGRIDTSILNPRGNLNVDLDARDLSGVIALLARFAPDAAEPLRRVAPGATAARLRGTFNLDAAPGGSGIQGRLGIEGRVGVLRVAINGQASGDTKSARNADIALDGKLEADDGGALVALVGLDRLLAVDKRPGTLSFTANGRADRDVRIETRIVAGGLDAGTSGALRFASGEGVSGALRLSVATAYVRPLRRATAGQASAPVPTTFSARLTLAGSRLGIDELNGLIAGTAVRGKLALTLAQPNKIDGELEAESIDAGGLIAAAAAMPVSAASAEGWSGEPFGASFIGSVEGRVQVKAARATITPAFIARGLRGSVLLGAADLSVDNLDAELDGGRLSGKLTLRNTEEGLGLRARIGLAGADAAAMLPSLGRPPIIGRLGIEADVSGAGRSPAALVGSLSGTGKVTLENAQIPGLDPRVFDVVIRAADRGLPIDGIRVGDAATKALDGGSLSLPRFEGPLAISAGQLRMPNTVTRTAAADLALAGTLNLADNTLDGRIVLTGTQAEIPSGTRPDLFIGIRGPLTAPSRNVDASALAGWLTLRAVEHQTKRLEAVESTAGSDPARSSPPRQRPKPPTPAAPLAITPEPEPSLGSQH